LINVTITAAPEQSADCAELSALSPLEVRVLRLATSRAERAARPVPATRLRRWWRRTSEVLLAQRIVGPLADTRLEALRSYAIAVRDHRPRPVATLIAAGYTEALARCIDGFVAARAAVTGTSAAARSRRSRVAEAAGITLGIVSIGGFIALTGVMATMA
jgi:hypothetical protein